MFFNFLFAKNKSFNIVFLSAFVLLILQMYLNTGTLSAYAVTIDNPYVIGGNIVNYDYKHYQCNYDFIMGEPAEKWNFGWVLRRELFYILAFPFLKIFGFYIGGIIAAITITLISFYAFIRFIYNNLGVQQAYVGVILLSTYPGIMYWIGSPFAQVMIVPCCLLIYMLMWKMNYSNKLNKHILFLSLISILFTAYDLILYFYPTILFIYFRKQQWKKMIISLPIMLIPQLAMVLWINMRGVTELKSDNTGLYFTIINSYLNPGDLLSWLHLIFLAPKILLLNYLDSNFWFLPILFIILVVVGVRNKIWLNTIETGILLSAFAIFIFNNLAPVYSADFLMRGEWIARIYQPIFVALLMYIVRFYGQIYQINPNQKRVFVGLILTCSLLNIAINLGGCFKSNLTQLAWYRFYQHSSPDAMQKNLKIYGVKPIGFSRH